MMPKESNLVWIDLEMTGLDPARDRILEIATVVTDSHLAVVAEGPVIAIHQSEQVLTAMDDWNKQHHGESGLLERVRISPFDLAAAERRTLDFLQQHSKPGESPLCGNSICQDRRFLARWMPHLEAQRWAPSVAEGFKKSSAHVALQDIRESIAELRHYREHLLRY
jgi:oligoribonuclease